MGVSVVTTVTFRCDFASCQTQFEGDSAHAAEAGWTYAQDSYPVDSSAPTPSVRCPAHTGQ